MSAVTGFCLWRLIGPSTNRYCHRFSAFWLRSKCSICSYQLNIWYGLHSRSRILNWFLTDWIQGWACSPGSAGCHGIALPPCAASFKTKLSPDLSQEPDLHMGFNSQNWINGCIQSLHEGKTVLNTWNHLFRACTNRHEQFYFTQIYTKIILVFQFWSHVTKNFCSLVGDKFDDKTVVIILTWHRGYCDQQGSSPRSRLFHCTSVELKPAIPPNVGNSGA